MADPCRVCQQMHDEAECFQRLTDLFDDAVLTAYYAAEDEEPTDG